jgi:hypothetical protein
MKNTITADIKNTVNEAIIEVCTNKYKKDARQAHELLEDLGYKIEKWNGCYHIMNKETHRTVTIDLAGGWRTYYVVTGTTKGNIRFDHKADLIKVDYVGILNKPWNTAWVDAQDYRWQNVRPTINKYNTLKWKKTCIADVTKDIEKTKKEIEYLQDRLIKLATNKVRYETELQNLRNKFGI